jgi:Trypsin
VIVKPKSPVALAGVLAALLVSAPAVAVATPRHPAHPRHRQRALARASVIGGAPAPAGAFTSVVEVVYVHGSQASQCTGTVVAASLILTAGHCAENISTGAVNRASGYRVLIDAPAPAGANAGAGAGAGTDTGAGTGALAGASGERQIATVSAVIVYERFARRSDDGDAALLVLSTPTATAPVTLAGGSAASAARAGSVATIAGWGDTSFQQRLPNEALQVAGTVVQPARWCARNARPFFAAGEICTIDPPSYATGACHGDSGGPLLAAQGPAGELVQIGITIHGYARCSTRLASVFTRVASIVPWLDAWIAAYAPRTATSSPAPAPPSSSPQGAL